MEDTPVMNPVPIADSDFDVDMGAWYASRQRPQVLQMPLPDGTMRSVEIRSPEDIARFMITSGLVKQNAASAAALEGRPVVSPCSDVPLPNIRPKKTAAAPVALVAPTPLEDYGVATMQEVQRALGVVDVPEPKPAKTVKVTRVKDFSCLQLPWLKDKPADPTVLVKFSSEYGEFETYYHSVVVSGQVVYLVFDGRCKFGRFFPKMGSGLVKIEVGKDGWQAYDGVLWADASFALGILEVTPFVLASRKVIEEETQVAEKEEEEEEEYIPDYDWALGNLET